MAKERNYLIHPSFIILTLIIAGVTSLFLAFSISYIYLRAQTEIEAIKLPSLFFFNTLVLIFSSISLNTARGAYLEDKTEKYQWLLVITMILSLVFLFGQCIAWYQLFSQGIFVGHNNMSAFMYLISGVHFAHVIVGIPFLAIFIREAFLKMKEPVSVLVYFSDPSKLRKLKLLTTYWHFLDVLWIYLVLFLYLNYAIG